MRCPARLFFCFFISSFAIDISWAQNSTPSTAPAQTNQTSVPTPEQLAAAAAAGMVQGQTLGNGIADTSQNGLATKQANYDSILISSTNTLMNSQLGQATANMLSGSLATASSGFVGSCDPTTIDGAKACSTGSVLAGMSGLALESGTSFDSPITSSWNNVCEFSTIGCGGIIPNPYTPIVNTDPPPTQSVYQGLIQNYENKGYAINPKTGVVTKTDGSTIDPNNQSSLKNGLSSDGYNSLTKMLADMQKEIAVKLAKVTKSSFWDALGLNSLKQATKQITKTVNDFAQKNDNSKDVLHFNQLPEKKREKIQISSLMKNYNGSPIGVAAADIFKMIKLRYEAKMKEQYFFMLQKQQAHP
jgi:hypothetical protein